MPHSHSDHSSSSGSASESFCLSSCSDYDSDIPPFSLTSKFTLKADPTIYSFAWSESNSESPPIPAVEAATKDHRLAPPPLPRPTCWTSLTHPDIFKEYISAERLGQQRSSSNTPSVATEETRETTQETQEPLSKNYSNAEHINAANTDKLKIVANVPHTWVDNHILACRYLPTLQFTPRFKKQRSVAGKELATSR